MAEITKRFRSRAPGSRFKREERQGGVAGFAVILGPLNDDDWKADPDLPTWGVAIRTRGQDDNMILTGTFNPEIGPWSRFESSMIEYASIVLQTLMHATLNPGGFDDERGRAA